MTELLPDRVIEAIERQVMIDVLESDVSLVNTDKMRGLLDRTLKAWRSWSDLRREVARMLRPKSVLGQLVRMNNKDNYIYDEPHHEAFDDNFLRWFDGQVMTLTCEQKSALNKASFDRDNRHRADDWAREWGYMSVATYYTRLKDAREVLIDALVNRFR